MTEPTINADQIADALSRPRPTAQQRAVIESPLAPALVVAGAGSGKTETMAGRVLWLLANRMVDPSQILGLTFTRKAAGELALRIRERIADLARVGLLGEGYDPFDAPTVATNNSYANSLYTVRGWVRTRRDSKACSFIELTDGSCFKGLQVVVDAALPCSVLMPGILTGASVEIDGDLIASPAQGQRWELQAKDVRLLGEADGTYPLQKKGHTPEFLRTIAHLRPRTNLYGSVFRVRSKMAFAVHRFFQERGFFYVHTPIVTSSDCEGRRRDVPRHHFEARHSREA